MENEKRLIDANALKEQIINEIHHYWLNGDGGYYLAEDVIPDIDNAPTVDAVEIKVLESWLCQIAINSMSNPMDNNLGLVCEMLIERLDGLRKFARERREGECI